MADYRLYLLKRDGGIADRVELTCEGDEEAIRLAEEHPDPRPKELWCGDRYVKKVTPPASP